MPHAHTVGPELFYHLKRARADQRTDQSDGALAAIARGLLILSASLRILALELLVAAVLTCSSFLSAFGRLLSSVTSSTSEATSLHESFSN
jgi:hypothetical protein